MSGIETFLARLRSGTPPSKINVADDGTIEVRIQQQPGSLMVKTRMLYDANDLESFHSRMCGLYREHGVPLSVRYTVSTTCSATLEQVR